MTVVAAQAGRAGFLLSVLALALPFLFWLHLSLGDAAVPVWQGLHDRLTGTESLAALVIGEIRFPRALLALLVGAALGAAGAAMQGLLRNPLAEPGLLGVSSGASFFAVLCFYFGMTAWSVWLLPLAGLLGAGLAVLCMLLLAGRNSAATTLILAGVAVNAVLASGTALALNFAPNPYAISEIVHWLLGSFSNRSMQDVALAAPFILLGVVLLHTQGGFLAALTLGEQTAESLGFSVHKRRLLLVWAIAACVGASVAVSGAIGFVGLVIPHLLRPLVGHHPARLLPVSTLGGAVFLSAADAVVQLLPTAQEIRIGVVTALVGGPFFLWLMARLRGSLQ